MNEFHLQIVTPDGLLFDGNVQMVVVRSIAGDVCILARHINYVTALSVGKAKVFTQSGERIAACAGGILSVTNGKVRINASTFEWSDNIDVERAQKAKEKAETMIKNRNSERELKIAQYKLKKALIRLEASKNK